MVLPLAAAFTLPIIPGLASAAGIGTAAAGAAGAAGAGLGTAGLLSGAGALLGGGASLANAFMGGGGGGSAAPGYDYASLYAYQAQPGNVALTTAGSELANLMAAYTGTQGITSKVLGQTAYDQFDTARQQQQTLSGLQAGIASQYASGAIGNENLAGKAKIAAEMMGPEVASALTKQYAEGVQQLATEGLKGQMTLLTPGATALAQSFTDAQRATNKLAGDIASANLRIKEQQENTRNQAFLARQQFSNWQAKKQVETSLAMGAHQAFA